MELDLARADLQNEQDLRSDVCIVGGGIAGLVLADRLTSAGVEVLLLEAGGAAAETETQALAAEVKLAGEPHRGTTEGRTWALGGSSLTWGGQLLPLSPGTRWPVDATALEAHLSAVQHLLGVDDLSYEVNGFFSGGARSSPPLLPFPGCSARVSKFAPFGRRNLAASLGRKLLAHPTTRVLLHAQATELVPGAEGDRIEAVRVHSPDGRQLRVQAKQIVVAAGTVETCRLLLASRSLQQVGVGNAYDQVGRNFHDHLTIEAAHFCGKAREQVIAGLRPWVVGGATGTVHAVKLEAEEELCQRLGLNPVLAHVTFEEPEGSGVAALRNLLRARQNGAETRGFGRWLALPGASVDVLRLYREAIRGRRYVSRRAHVALRINLGQVPSASRIRLGGSSDSHGMPIASVDWHFAPEDLRTIRVFAGHLRSHMDRIGLDEAAGTVWQEIGTEGAIAGIEDARHAMGGACMGTDPRTSVVDPQLRVHGVENLFLASPAVFPDGSPQLPTLTLMELTLRLAEHLRSGLQG